VAVHPSSAPTIAFVRQQREQLLGIAKRFGVSELRIFGSVARGESRPGSDVDIVVRFDEPPEGLAYFGRLAELRRELSDALGCDVDVLDAQALRRIANRVEREAVLL
jgi:uncharacterized protein